MSLLSLCFKNNFESDRAAFLYQRYQRRENKEIVLTRIGLARKGDPHKGCERHTTTTKSRSSSCAWRFVW